MLNRFSIVSLNILVNYLELRLVILLIILNLPASPLLLILNLSAILTLYNYKAVALIRMEVVVEVKVVVVVIVVIKGVNKVLYYYLRHHDRAYRRVGDYRDLGTAKKMKINLKRFKAAS